MGSRFVIGASAWLLGAASATAGSLYAVAQLGQGLVGQHTRQVTLAMVNAELRRDRFLPPTAASPSPSASPRVSPSSATRPSGAKHHVTPRVTYSTKWLTLRGGVVEAACSQDGAQLLSATATPGFETHNYEPGPGTWARVSFITPSFTGVTVTVTCDSAGAPITKVSDFPGGGWQHDE